MKLSLIEEKKFPLLNRKQARFELVYSGVTPKGEEVKELVVKNLKAENDKVVVKGINVNFGSNKADVLAYVYDDLESLDKYEKIHKKVKKKDAKKEEAKE